MAHRVQFDIDDEVYERALPFIEGKKFLAHYGKKAFGEWLGRLEARKGRSLSQDEETIRRIIREVLGK